MFCCDLSNPLQKKSQSFIFLLHLIPCFTQCKVIAGPCNVSSNLPQFYAKCYSLTSYKMNNIKCKIHPYLKSKPFQLYLICWESTVIPTKWELIVFSACCTFTVTTAGSDVGRSLPPCSDSMENTTTLSVAEHSPRHRLMARSPCGMVLDTGDVL